MPSRSRVPGRFRQPLADDLLGPAPAVDVRGVDEITALLDEPVELRVGAVGAGLRAERHGARTQRRHQRPGAAEGSILHTTHAIRIHRGIHCDHGTSGSPCGSTGRADGPTSMAAVPAAGANSPPAPPPRIPTSTPAPGHRTWWP